MIDYIKGTIEDISAGGFTVETGGVGFHIESNAHSIGRVKLHDQVKVYTHMNVREDDMSLFGFLSKDEVNAFRLLIGVSGIGPKNALSILSELTVDELRLAVISEDTKAIARANGVGQKTAQRAIIELKDKFKLEDTFGDSYDDAPTPDGPEVDVISETAMALASLGYSNVEALRAIKKVGNAEGKTSSELLKLALKHL